MLEKNIFSCQICGKKFERRGVGKKAFTCSNVCAGKRNSLNNTTTNKCEICGKVYKVQNRAVKRRKTCSIGCRSKYLSQRFHGEKNHMWKGGIIVFKDGYRYVKSYDHPYKNSGGYVAEHRLLMEKKLGRYLTKNEQVHHRNGIKGDNRIDNLEIVIDKLHKGNVCCPYCQKIFAVK